MKRVGIVSRTVLVSLVLIALTLLYSGRWGDVDPRGGQQPTELQVADAGSVRS